MAQLRLHSTVNAPDELILAMIANPDGELGERAVARLGERGYEGDEALYLVQTDGWAERRTQHGELIVDIVAYPDVLKSLHLDPAAFSGRSAVDPTAIRLLTTSIQATPAECERLRVETFVVTAASGTPAEQILADVDSGDLWPLILAPPPDIY
jgi:hypothetical protein